MPEKLPVKKTSVYLPERLKARLAAAARRTGWSEAELVRSAVEQLVSETAGPRPEAPSRPAGPALVGVGVGPGDPGLMTVRALDELRAADRVLAPSTSPEAVGRAEAVVRGAAPDVVVDRLVFTMAHDEPARRRAVEDAAATIAERLAAGEYVAVISLGDPNVFSAFGALAEAVRRLRPDVPVSTVPGVMAFQDLAARAGVTVVAGDERLVVVAGQDGVADAAADPGTAVVVYKGGRDLPRLADQLDALDRLDDAVLGELLGQSGGRLVPLAEAATRPPSYLATVVVPPARAGDRTLEDAS